MKRNLLLSLLAGVVLFVWGFVSWVVLPWHMNVAKKFADETAVAQFLKQNAPEGGIYYLPFSEKDYPAGQTTAFMNVRPNGYGSDMGKAMAIGFIGQAISAFLVLTLLGWAGAGASGCGKKVGFFAFMG